MVHRLLVHSAETTTVGRQATIQYSQNYPQDAGLIHTTFLRPEIRLPLRILITSSILHISSYLLKKTKARRWLVVPIVAGPPRVRWRLLQSSCWFRTTRTAVVMRGIRQSTNAIKDACCGDKEPGQPAITKFACNDSSRGDSKEPVQDHSCKLTEVTAAAGCRDTRNSRSSGQAKKNDCCDSKTDIQDDGRCKPLEIVPSSCQDGCYSGSTKKAQCSVGCGTKDIKVDDDCYSAPEPSQAGTSDKLSCCKDKSFPCCDVSCLNRVALRLCRNEKQAAQLDEACKSKLECSLYL
jgi:hypothetical protein